MSFQAVGGPAGLCVLENLQVGWAGGNLDG